MTLDRLKATLSVALLFSAIILVSICAFYAYRIGHKTSTVLDSANQTAASINSFVGKQTSVLESQAYQLAIKRNLDIGEETNALLKGVRKTTLPRINLAIERFDHAGDELTLLVRNTDTSINGKIAPQLTQTIQDTDEAIKTASELLNSALTQLTPRTAEVLLNLSKTSTTLNEILSDPAIKASLQEIAASSAAVHQSTENLKASTDYIEQAFKQFPDIAADIRAYTKATSKSTKYVIAARIVAALIPIVNTLPR